MYLTDVRGFTAEDYILLNSEKPILFENAQKTCKITVHGMGFQGDKGFTLSFARFCTRYRLDVRFISVSDMGIAFFIPFEDKKRVLNLLCEYFPIWV